ncbi:MAG: hypothetical protein V4557_18690 [Bacteroidota bacterium]
MKKNPILVSLLILLILTGMACVKSAGDPIPNTISGRWTLTDKQAPGTGPPGVWSVANPAGQWMEILQNGQVSGTVFPDATVCQVVDSVTVKLVDPSQTAGFRLFNYRVDTIERALYFYIRPSSGGYCNEGCGTYKFRR